MTYISGIGIKKYQIIQFHLYQFSKLRAYKYKRQIFLYQMVDNYF